MRSFSPDYRPISYNPCLERPVVKGPPCDSHTEQRELNEQQGFPNSTLDLLSLAVKVMAFHSLYKAAVGAFLRRCACSTVLNRVQSLFGKNLKRLFLIVRYIYIYIISDGEITLAPTHTEGKHL